MISDHIKDIITAVKATPNSLERNKAVSHLEDARVWVESLEAKEKSKFGEAPASRSECTCPAGAIDKTCPIHGA